MAEFIYTMYKARKAHGDKVILDDVTMSFLPGAKIDPAAFALVGMGGFFAGVSKCPLTSIVMVCEMTGSYSLLVPLMLVCGLNIGLSRRWTL